VRNSRLFLTCFAWLLSGQCAAQAEPNETPWLLCQNPEFLPMFRELGEPVADQDLLPVDIFADNLDVSKDYETAFQGNVEMERGQSWLNTESLFYNHQTKLYRTGGQVKFQNELLRMIADSAEGNEETGSIILSGLKYQFHESNGNGTAERASMQGGSGQLKNADFSTCPVNQKQWRFRAAQIDIDEQSSKGTARNVKLELGGVPVLWLPYLRFPTDNERASGFLVPAFGQDSLNGIDLSIPYYFNLAPNYDATITPRYLSNRGYEMGGEFRYLFGVNSGLIEATYLPNDEIRDIDRYLLSWKDFSAINKSWFFESNLNTVSDVNYFSDLGTSIEETSTALLESNMGLFGRGKYWDLNLSVSKWEVANPTQPIDTKPYSRLPSLSFFAGKPITPWLDVGIYAQAVSFNHEELKDGNRLDVTAYVRTPIKGDFWYATPSFSWRQTEYLLGEDLGILSGGDTISRGLPIVSFDAGASFERFISIGETSYIQTLEPRLFYLYVPYVDQDNIPVFDTRELTFMWSSLFRENSFGGADRQTDANQITLALVSRYLSTETGKDRLNLSLGRTIYFVDPRVRLPLEPPPQGSGSDWVADANVRLTDQWQIGFTQQWDPSTNTTNLSSIRGDWISPNGLQIGASYRYRRDFVEQTNVAFVLPVSKNWRALGRWDYSLRDNQRLETLLGFEWRSCCMGVQFYVADYVRSFSDPNNLSFFIQLDFNGIGDIGNRARLFDEDGILAY
jgi:LPS-assembly protein